jgi:DNA-binding response OmpR family regulator
MPGHDGHHILRSVRSLDETRHIPILVLTGLSDLGEAMQCMGEGADDYLTKPFNMNELEARVEMLLCRRAQREGLQ